MTHRFIVICFLLLYANTSFANKPIWNCEKTAGKEWACQTSEETSSQAIKTQINETKTATAATHQVAKPLNSPITTTKQITDTVTTQVPVANQVITKSVKPIITPQRPRDEETAVVRLPKAVPFRAAPISKQPPVTSAKSEGWTCTDANEDSDKWNCSLVGADPQGEVKAIKTRRSNSFSLFAPAFDFNQENIFEQLQSELAYNPWESCSGSTHTSTSATEQDKHFLKVKLADDVPMDVHADYSEVFDKDVTSFFGNVEIIRADQRIMSDNASYDTVSDTMDAQGHVYYREDEISLYSETALLNLGTNEARLRKALFISPAPFRGSADVVYRDSKFLSRYKNATVTSCPPNNQDWAIHAQRLKMNKQTGKASAKHAWLEFKGLPMFYTPYVSFPMDDRRLSGILPPTWGANDKNGLDLVIPYYWNIAPNYDLTLYPRYMSKRGGMLSGDFRYLTNVTKGSLGLEFLPYDTLKQIPRYSGTFKNQTQFSQNMYSDIDLNYVSDDEYFDDLNNALGISNSRHLRSHADLNFQSEKVAFNTRIETYQTTDKDITDKSKPYQKLPEVNLSLNHSFDNWPVDLQTENQYIHFYRNGRVSGHRFNIKPSISVPLETASGFLKPKVSLQHTRYYLTDQVAGQDDEIDRTLPIFSVDSGLFFERDLNLAGNRFIHTLEPRLFYLYIPETNQDDIPLFDSSEFDFSYNSLFRENRFSGTDRIQDANQITVAMSSRLIDAETGREHLNISLGEIFYFQDREVAISGASETSAYSNVIARLNSQFSRDMSFSSELQWSPEYSDFMRGQLYFQYKDPQQKIINLGYRYRKNNQQNLAEIIQTDASFRWPLYDQWFAVGRWQYSLRYNSTKESFIGLEKESCCWRFRVIYRRFANSVSDNRDSEMDEGIFVQLELKGLTSFGDKVDNFLERNLKGYQRAD